MSAPVTGLEGLPTAEAQLQKLMVAFQQKELAVAAEIRPNNITVNYDLESLTATFSAANVPITVTTPSNGDVTITATAYPSLS